MTTKKVVLEGIFEFNASDGSPTGKCRIGGITYTFTASSLTGDIPPNTPGRSGTYWVPRRVESDTGVPVTGQSCTARKTHHGSATETTDSITLTKV